MAEEEEREEARMAREVAAKKPPAKDELGRKKRKPSKPNHRVLTLRSGGMVVKR